MGIRGSRAHLLRIKASWVDVSGADPQKQRPEHPPAHPLPPQQAGQVMKPPTAEQRLKEIHHGDNPPWASRRAGETPLQLVFIISGF